MSTALALGATLYMPATRSDLWAVVSGEKFPALRSLVICLEDAVLESEINLGLAHLKQLLSMLKHEPRAAQHPLVFVRPRHLEMVKQLSEWPLIDQIDGMVLPKFNLSTLAHWHASLPPSLWRMPTLETPDVFDMGAMLELREALTQDFDRVLALRIGGNDLLNCLGIRRPTCFTLYQTPIGQLIGQLCGQFLPHGFALTAPVFEHFHQVQLFKEELALDLNHGLIGKTIIHPSQIDIVHQAYQVERLEWEQAQHLLAADAHAVFSHQGSMLEPATHRRWAESIMQRSQIFGIRSSFLDEMLASQDEALLSLS